MIMWCSLPRRMMVWIGEGLNWILLTQNYCLSIGILCSFQQSLWIEQILPEGSVCDLCVLLDSWLLLKKLGLARGLSLALAHVPVATQRGVVLATAIHVLTKTCLGYCTCSTRGCLWSSLRNHNWFNMQQSMCWSVFNRREHITLVFIAHRFLSGI